MTLASLKKSRPIRRIMGLDLSTHSMAFSIFEDGKLVKWGEVNFPGKTAFERLHEAGEIVRQIASHLRVDKIVFEGAVFVQNKKTVIALAYSYGAIVSALAYSGVVIEEVSPMTWQNKIGNKSLSKVEKSKIQSDHPGKSKSWYDNLYRETRKERTRQWVRDTYDIHKASDNLNDAIGVGYFGLG